MIYNSPFNNRYASKEMLNLFTPLSRTKIWRQLWVSLAEAEKELGLNITQEQIDDLKNNVENIDFEYIAEQEKILKHDVMAHINGYGKVAPLAAPIIHLGATSAFVQDNSDVITMREGLRLIEAKLVTVLNLLSDAILKYRFIPTLSYTHFQPAQLTTVGKRLSLYAQDFLMDLNKLQYTIDNLRLLGCKGTTGTQASFLYLFDGDADKVYKLDELICKKHNFSSFDVSGQIYTRKQDSYVVTLLADICSSAFKFANDLRLLASHKEVEEPFDKTQVGSSAMAYKRNPMRSERICSLARFGMSLVANTYTTHAENWLERTLDDSANRRLVLAESFFTVDSVLRLVANVIDGIVVNEAVIAKRVNFELPFLATENILMESVKRGKGRQETHEVIRELSLKVASELKLDPNVSENNLIKYLAEHEEIPLTLEEIEETLNPVNFIGLASEQAYDFVYDKLIPLTKKYQQNSDFNYSIDV